MLVFLAILGCAAAVLLVARWAIKRSLIVDDYFEREFRDPPVHGWISGGGPNGF